jgi:hypothetical protein
MRQCWHDECPDTPYIHPPSLSEPRLTDPGIRNAPCATVAWREDAVNAERATAVRGADVGAAAVRLDTMRAAELRVEVIVQLILQHPPAQRE